MPRCKQCIVIDCPNTEKVRFELRKKQCNDHNQMQEICGCSVFKLHKFPAAVQQRKVWVKAVNREDVTFNNSRKNVYLVCSNHFPDRQPTKENPYPLVNMGYNCPDLETLLLACSTNSEGDDSSEEIQDNDLEPSDSTAMNASGNPEETARNQDATSEMENALSNEITDNSTLLKDLVDPLPIRRERRNIKKTYKALKFEEEKLANKKKFGRCQDRTSLVPKSPVVQDISIELRRLDESRADSLASRISSFEDVIKKEIESDVSDGDVKVQDVLTRDLDFEVLDGKTTVNKSPCGLARLIVHQCARKRTLPSLPLKKKKGVIKIKTMKKKSPPKPRKRPVEPTCKPVPKKLKASKRPIRVFCDQDTDEEVDDGDPYFDSIYQGYVSYKDSALDSDIEGRMSYSDGSNFSEGEDYLSSYSDLECYSPRNSDEKILPSYRKSNKKPMSKNYISTAKSNPTLKRTIANNKHGAKNITKKAKYSSPQEPEIGELGSDYDNYPCSDQSEFSDYEDEFSDLEDYPQSESIQQGWKAGKYVEIPRQNQIQRNSTSIKPQLKPSITESFSGVQKPLPKVVQPHPRETQLISSYWKEDATRNDRNKRNADVLGSESEYEEGILGSESLDKEHDGQGKPECLLATTSSKDDKLPTFSTIWRKLKTYYDYTEEEDITLSSPNYQELEGYVVYEEGAELAKASSNPSLIDTLTEEKCRLYTGFSLIVFKGLLGILKDHAPKYDPSFELSVNDQILLVIMKLKLGLINADLAKKFNLLPAMCGKVFSSWITIMADTLRHLIVWQPREFVLDTMPKGFQKHLPLTSCLIDTGQICIQLPVKEKQAFKKDVQNTRRFLFAVAPNGFVMFMSEPFGGEASENQMFVECSIKDKLQSGDLVLLNKELSGTVELPSDILLDVQPHVKAESEDRSLNDESEKAVGRLKSYRILRGVITVPLASASSVLNTCAALCNLSFSH